MNIIEAAREIEARKMVKRKAWLEWIGKKPGLMGEYEIQWLTDNGKVKDAEDYEPVTFDNESLLAEDWMVKE